MKTDEAIKILEELLEHAKACEVLEFAGAEKFDRAIEHMKRWQNAPEIVEPPIYEHEYFKPRD